MEKATELEYLHWFFVNADFGPADEDVRDQLNERFVEETGKELPEGYDVKEVEKNGFFFDPLPQTEWLH